MADQAKLQMHGATVSAPQLCLAGDCFERGDAFLLCRVCGWRGFCLLRHTDSICPGLPLGGHLGKSRWFRGGQVDRFLTVIGKVIKLPGFLSAW